MAPPETNSGSLPDRPTRIIAMINQKGGVGKTTSTANLGAALASLGHRVLLVDLDPQAHLSLHVGVDPAAVEQTIYDVFTEDDVTATSVMKKVNDNLFVLPAEVNLAGVEAELATKTATGGAQRILKNKLAPLVRSNDAPIAVTIPIGKPSKKKSPTVKPFDYVLLDCPPSLGLLTINGLVAATEVVVPMQAHFLALQGLSKLLETVSLIRQSFNPHVKVSGVILCMYEGQTLLASEVIADLTSFLDAHRQMDVPWRDAKVLKPPIRRNIKLAECPSFGKTIFDYQPDCAGAKDYEALAQSLAEHCVHH